MVDCTFCRIICDEPQSLVLHHDGVAAFLDIRPLFPGHLLVVPTDHVATLDELPPDRLAPLFTAVQACQRAVVDVLDAHGTFVAINNVVSQSVPHLHVHVVPRRRGDGLRGFFWPRTGYDDEAHRVSVRDRLRDRLAAT